MRTTPDPSDVRRRIELTVAVRDTDAIPKVDDAGEVVVREGRRVQVMHNGVVVEEGCYYGDWMTEIIRRLRGHHEPQEEAAFHAVVERLRADPGERPTMVELGSFWAYYSLWAKQAIPGLECICVEPDPQHLEVGRRNFALNDMSARFVHAAVGEPHGGSIWLECESDRRVRQTPVVSLQGLLDDHDVATVDLLLCDVQGAELALLAGARTALRERRVRFLVVSTHHHSFSGDPLTHQRCLQLLGDAGAHVIAEHSISESCSGDGLIVASTDPGDADLQVELSVVRARDSLFGEVEYELAGALKPSAPARRALLGAVARLDRLRRRR